MSSSPKVTQSYLTGPFVGRYEIADNPCRIYFINQVMKGDLFMSEYRDIHNNVFNVIQRTVVPETEEDRKIAKEVILDDLFNIFAPVNNPTAKAERLVKRPASSGSGNGAC